MNILITRHDKIGDFVTMLPVCKVLKEQTRHNITMLCAKVNVPLAKELDFIDDVIEYREDSSLIKEIKKCNFDVSISGFIDNKLGYKLWRSNIKTRIAPATKFAQLFFNKRVKQRRSQVKMREFEYNLELLKALDKNIKLNFKNPLYAPSTQFSIPNSQFSIPKPFIIFHPGFGGSSDGNLTLDDYVALAKVASEYINVVFTFGPDDIKSKEYIKSKLDFTATIKDDFKDIVELTKFIAQSRLFVSTSTGPMHLAGLTNTATLSFFGDSLFASYKRWGTISDKDKQSNFLLNKDYSKNDYLKIEHRLLEIING